MVARAAAPKRTERPPTLTTTSSGLSAGSSGPKAAPLPSRTVDDTLMVTGPSTRTTELLPGMREWIWYVPGSRSRLAPVCRMMRP